MRKRLNLLEELEKLRLSHHQCEDGWYSCPKSENGCLNDNEEDECNCEAERHNQQIDKIINYIKSNNTLSRYCTG